MEKGWLQKWKDNFQQNGNGNKPKKSYRYIAIILLAGILLMIASIFTGNKENPQTNSQNGILQSNDASAKDKENAVATWGTKSNPKSGSMGDMEKSYEQQLKSTLEVMQGVKDVSVIVNVDATEKKVYEKNGVSQRQTTEETDRDGGQRTVEDYSKDEKVVIIREGDKEVPLVQETKKPAIRGVLIVAKGADNIRIKKEIIDAVTRALDVPSHRVAVMAKK